MLTLAQGFNSTALTPATSPPTPSQRSEVNSQRSGTASRGSPGSRALNGVKSGRVEKAPPKKKKERAKAPKRVAKLEKPLSEVTKDWAHVPVVDIEAYVNRSAETRQLEVEQGKIPGKIKRPMNAFMLYRKAYQNRTKHWCMQHNHQIVSQVCGESWPLEPESIRLQFNEWAKTERANHHNAHPGYKFTPAKPRKKPEREDFGDGGSDGSDGEWAPRRGGGGTRSRPQNNRTELNGVDADYQQPRSAYAHHHSHYAAPMSMPQTVMPLAVAQARSSAFHYANPGKAYPGPYTLGELGTAYYQQDIQPGTQQGVEDVMLRRMPSPHYSYQPHPDDAMFTLAAPYAPMSLSSPQPGMQDQPDLALTFEQSIDPSILPQDGPFDPFLLEGALNSQLDTQQWSMQQAPLPAHDSPHPQYGDGLGLEETLLGHGQHQDELLRGTNESWKIDVLDRPDQFDNWQDFSSQPEE